MTEYDKILIFTGITVSMFGARAYFMHRDAFHPAVFISILMLFGYSVWPLILNSDGQLEMLFGRDPIAEVALYYLGALVAFELGLIRRSRAVSRLGGKLTPWHGLASSLKGRVVRRRLWILAALFATLSLLAYWSSIANAGGFEMAYSRYKGGGVTVSGYIGEAVLLSYPAAIIVAVARQGRGLRAMHWLLILLILSPNLAQGTFGVRRGPLFISLASIFLCATIARGKAPGLFRVAVGLCLIMSAVIFMWSQRQAWFGRVESDVGFSTTLIPEESRLTENDYVSGIGSALITKHYDGFFWGRRWAVDLFIRPIPRQLWPTKYKDVGAHWAETTGNPTGFDESEQARVIGFRLVRGHSMGVLSDLYSEWWWFALPVLYMFGAFLRWLWMKHRTVGQVWTVIFLLTLGLCIYLPTQSFSAWYQRFLIMAVVTFVSWRWVVGQDVKDRSSREGSPGDRPSLVQGR